MYVIASANLVPILAQTHLVPADRLQGATVWELQNRFPLRHGPPTRTVLVQIAMPIREKLRQLSFPCAITDRHHLYI